MSITVTLSQVLASYNVTWGLLIHFSQWLIKISYRDATSQEGIVRLVSTILWGNREGMPRELFLGLFDLRLSLLPVPWSYILSYIWFKAQLQSHHTYTRNIPEDLPPSPPKNQQIHPQVRIFFLNQAKERMGKGKRKIFLLGFNLQKGSIKNNFSWLMKDEISQAGSCTDQRELMSEFPTNWFSPLISPPWKCFCLTHIRDE